MHPMVDAVKVDLKFTPPSVEQIEEARRAVAFMRLLDLFQLTVLDHLRWNDDWSWLDSDEVAVL